MTRELYLKGKSLTNNTPNDNTQKNDIKSGIWFDPSLKCARFLFIDWFTYFPLLSFSQYINFKLNSTCIGVLVWYNTNIRSIHQQFAVAYPLFRHGGIQEQLTWNSNSSASRNIFWCRSYPTIRIRERQCLKLLEQQG